MGQNRKPFVSQWFSVGELKASVKVKSGNGIILRDWLLITRKGGGGGYKMGKHADPKPFVLNGGALQYG